MSVSIRYGYRDMSLRGVTEVVRPLTLCLVSLVANTQDAVVLKTPSPPSGAGGTGPGAGGADFSSPTKHERNGLTGTELGTQTTINNMSS